MTETEVMSVSRETYENKAKGWLWKPLLNQWSSFTKLSI
jgi:hypothetical protein